jgi:hypothetical protein
MAPGLATMMAGVALAPFLWPYAQVRRLQGLSRTLDEVARYSAVPGDYLATVSRLHYEWWSHTFFRSDAFFPGALAVALAVVAIMSGRAWRDPRARMLLAMAVAGFALSLGPVFPLYGPLYQAFPLLEGIRGAARFGYLALVGVAGLAGFGTAWIAERLQARWPTGRPRRLASLALGAVVILVNVEAFAAPLHFVRAPGFRPSIASSPLKPTPSSWTSHCRSPGSCRGTRARSRRRRRTGSRWSTATAASCRGRTSRTTRRSQASRIP